ncbi:MAG: hypothetical protein A2Y76_05655 [Planctomycetes bacterium RBG_13_60_9]|nr:MAG: hypothetical protein A2Y76_05655 [Planctomycetes bacterium RBG_13_60_9]
MKLRHRAKIGLTAVLVLAAGVLMALLLRGPRLYTVTVLPSLDGLDMVPRSINDRGQVVGVAGPDNNIFHLFSWDRESGIRDLGPVRDSRLDNNNAGQIVGTTTDPNGRGQAFLWDPDRGMILLRTFGGSGSMASAINNRGRVVGCSFVPVSGAHGRDQAHAFLWDEAGDMRDLGTLGGSTSHAYAITDAGRVYGVSVVARDGRQFVTSCYWETADAGMPGMLLPGPGYAHMNGNGGIVAKDDSNADGSYIVLWDDDAGLRRLFRCKPDSERLRMTTLLINSMNQVASSEIHQHNRNGLWSRLTGGLFEPRVKSYVWDPRRHRIPLDRYVPRGMRDLAVHDLNNRGDIIAEAHEGNGGIRAILLEPIPSRWNR